MWFTICVLGSLIIGGVTSCIIGSTAPFENACFLSSVIGYGYYLLRYKD